MSLRFLDQPNVQYPINNKHGPLSETNTNVQILQDDLRLTKSLIVLTTTKPSDWEGFVMQT